MKEIVDSGIATKTTPGELYSLLEKQPDGPKSAPEPLLANGYANLFEMDDMNEIPRLVYALWNEDFGGWYVIVYDASYSHRWSDVNQLFSGNR